MRILKDCTDRLKVIRADLHAVCKEHKKVLTVIDFYVPVLRMPGRRKGVFFALPQIWVQIAGACFLQYACFARASIRNGDVYNEIKKKN